jgi:hypothetical protein
MQESDRLLSGILTLNRILLTGMLTARQRPDTGPFNHILRLLASVYALHAEVCHANNLAEHRRYPEPI